MNPQTCGQLIRPSRYLILSALMLGFPVLASSETPPADGAPDPATAGAATTGNAAPAAGLRIYLDPETGEITDRPTAEQIDKLSRALEPTLLRTAEGLEPFDLPGGGQGLFLAGRFRSATIARRRADGTFDQRCVETAEQAAILLETPPPETSAPAGDLVWEEK